jgi:hypothetical protein
MRTSESIKEISQAMAVVQNNFPKIAKSGENTFHKYSYANLSDYMDAVLPILQGEGLAIISSVPEVISLPERKTSKGGTVYPVQVRMKMLLVHKSGEWFEIDSQGEAQDGEDKAVYKAITGARKYGVACLLGLATGDEPEEDNPAHRAPPRAAHNTPKPAPRPAPQTTSAPLPTPTLKPSDTAQKMTLCANITAMMFDLDEDWNRFQPLFDKFKVDKLGDLPLANLQKVHDTLLEQQRGVGNAKSA